MTYCIKCFRTKKNNIVLHINRELLNGRNYLLNGMILAVNGKKANFLVKCDFCRVTIYSTDISSIKSQELPPEPKYHAGSFP